MHSTRQLGAALTVLGLGGYLVGVGTAYTGRAFTITLVMIGITLVSIGAGGSAA